MALKLPEQGTVIAASSFFVSFINLSETTPSVAEIVRVKGYPLVQYLLQAIAGAANRSYLTYYSDILYCLLCNVITSLSEWLEVSCEFVPVQGTTYGKASMSIPSL